MDMINIFDIDTEKFNPFGATPEELVSIALDEAGLNKDSTTINECLARELCNSYFCKRDIYRELTKLGNILLKNSVITKEQLTQALEFQKSQPDLKLGNAFLALNMCSLDDIEKSLNIQTQLRDDIEELEQFKLRVSNIKERLKRYMC